MFCQFGKQDISSILFRGAENGADDVIGLYRGGTLAHFENPARLRLVLDENVIVSFDK